MAKYDIIMPVNISDSGIEIDEKKILLTKGGLLIGTDSGPQVLSAGLDDEINVYDAQFTSGIKRVKLGDAATKDVGTGQSDVAQGDHTHNYSLLSLPVINDIATLKFDKNIQYYTMFINTLSGHDLEFQVNGVGFLSGKRSIVCITGDGTNTISFSKDFKILEGAFNAGSNRKNVIEMNSILYGVSLGTPIRKVLVRIYQI